ncbi:hypothetical protein D9756_005643 [Leucocoprinus leucothites]|uniref:BTB domain-containing protein n=1 Tax=Leucocoprinus leucothites TaxID=201217 RepID=A0A8H5D818_9AGAR|nr:hypothetical protein D9756_005643 [Leucoagaricus leucothites]
MAHLHSDSGLGFRSLTRYEEYYLPGGDLFLLVEQHIFRVHRYFFERESTYFKGKLATPAAPGSTRPGTNESNAILLDDVRVHEFARFLWVFYNPKYSLYHTSVADWTAILNLAHRWAFPEVKSLAVRELEKQSMPDIERVVVYQNNDVDRNLLIRCYAALCERDQPITPAEGRRMGIDTALTIAQLREMARRSPIDCRSPTSANIRGNELQTLVRELFGIATPVRDDDSMPHSPLGGPPPCLWSGSPVTAQTEPTQPSLQSMVQPPPTRATAQTVTPATTPPPPVRTATPPLPAAPAQSEPEVQPLDPTPPPPPLPEKTGRLQVITNPALAKVNLATETSRPSTPGPETPTTGPEKEKKKKKKVGKKAVAEKVAAEKAETATPKADEKESNAATEAEATLQSQQQPQEGQKDDATVLVDLDKKDDVTVSQQGNGAGSSGAPKSDVSSTGANDGEGEKAKAKAGSTTGGDGVSTDIPSTTTDPTQANDAKADPKANPTTLYKPSDPPASPTTRKSQLDNADFLKSPQEKEKTTLGFNLSKLGF